MQILNPYSFQPADLQKYMMLMLRQRFSPFPVGCTVHIGTHSAGLCDTAEALFYLQPSQTAAGNVDTGSVLSDLKPGH